MDLPHAAPAPSLSSVSHGALLACRESQRPSARIERCSSRPGGEDAREAIAVRSHAAPALWFRSFSGPGLCVPVEGTCLAADTCRMAKKPEPPKLFWLTYRHSDGHAAGAVVIESVGLLQARLKAALAGATAASVRRATLHDIRLRGTFPERLFGCNRPNNVTPTCGQTCTDRRGRTPIR